MQILNLSLGQDTGGQQMRLARAWKRYFPEDRYLSVTSTHTFYEIQHKLDKGKVANDWWPNSDLIHQNNDLHFATMRFPKRSLDLTKPMVIHHHGTMYRTRPDYHLAAQKQYNATSICSTIEPAYPVIYRGSGTQATVQLNLAPVAILQQYQLAYLSPLPWITKQQTGHG